MRIAVSAVALSAGLVVAAATFASPAWAQSSCSAYQSQCARRCKERVPDDKNCVSDHCTPKLNECRSTGCWQEGNLYGGKRACDLVKR